MMQWYFFILPQNNENFSKESNLIKLLSKLICKFNKCSRKDTLLLYRKPTNLNYIVYYFTSPKSEVRRMFARLNKAQRCLEPDFNKTVEFTEMKFLSGDVILWLNLLEVYK